MAQVQCDRATFLKNLQQSKLLKPRDYDKVVQRLPETEKGRSIARLLVEWGVLTRFQASLLLVGRTHGFFLGQYKILDEIGHGGMGRVFKAMHQPMKRIVALKVLAPQLMSTEKARRFFKREVRAAAQLNHSNIVTAFDANEISGRYYLAMEFVDGPNLEQLVRKQGRLPVNLACEVVRQAALGLQCAFEMNLVHRDIKPANLLLQKLAKSSLPQVKILDFGLAQLQQPKAEAAATASRSVMGTPDFLSPEQARNLPTIDIRSDLYSLGCTFYYLLAGDVPFPGGTSLEKLMRHAKEEPTPIGTHRAEVPEAVQQILMRMLAKTPEERFQTPQELADALTPHARDVGASLELPGAGVDADLDQAIAPSDAGSDSALPGTVSPQFDLTPVSEDVKLPYLDPDIEGRRQFRLAIYLSIGIMLGLIVIVSVLLWALLN